MDATYGITVFPDFHSADGHGIFHMTPTVISEPHKSFISNWYVTAPYGVLCSVKAEQTTQKKHQHVPVLLLYTEHIHIPKK